MFARNDILNIEIRVGYTDCLVLFLINLWNSTVDKKSFISLIFHFLKHHLAVYKA